MSGILYPKPIPYEHLPATEATPASIPNTGQIPSEDPPPYSLLDPNLHVPGAPGSHRDQPSGTSPYGLTNPSTQHAFQSAPNLPPYTTSVPHGDHYYGYPPSSVTIITEPVSSPQIDIVNRDPYMAHCPQCCQMVITRTEPQVGELTFLCFIFLLCFVGPFAFLVCLFDACKDVGHFCPLCGEKLSTFQALRA